MDRKAIKKTVHLALLILIAIVIISGLGISYYQTLEGITAGLLSKNLSFQLHTLLFLPFLLILLIHIFFSWLWPKKKSDK
jgi:ABC-type antimicrobial peptide transport system permease subunit